MMLPILLAIVYACLLIILSRYVINRRPSPRPRQQAATRRALAEVDRHQARLAIEVGMLEYQIHRNGDQVRQELRREMERWDDRERWQNLERWAKHGGPFDA